jgi:hypothetical protein
MPEPMSQVLEFVSKHSPFRGLAQSLFLKAEDFATSHLKILVH